MKKVIVSVCLFFVFLGSNVFAEAEIVIVEKFIGTRFEKIINFYEPKGSNNIVGTFECIRIGRRLEFCIRDVNGTEVHTSSWSGPFGGVEPLYDEADEHITGFRCFGSVTLSLLNGTTQFRVAYFDANLTWLYETLRWPIDESKANQKMHTPSGMITFADGSYMTIGLENNKKICYTLFNADDTIIGSEMNYLDMSAQSGGFVGSISRVKVAKLSDDQIIIGATVRSDKKYDLFLANINSNGEHNCAPLANFGLNEWVDDNLGEIVIYENQIIPIAESYGTMYGLVLTPNFIETNRFQYSSAGVDLDPFCATINSDGTIYVGGRVDHGSYEELLLYWTDINNPSEGQIITNELYGVITAINCMADYVFGGGNFWNGEETKAFRFSCVPDPIEPGSFDNDNDGFTENQGDCNDNDSTIYPGAEEIECDGIDQDCNGSDFCPPPPPDPNDVDNDNDGFTENQGDCNDSDNTIYPGALEIECDGIDQDCNGSDFCPPPPPDPNDIDNDGDGFTENQGDCNDSDNTIYPGALEIECDGIDQDCNGSDFCPPPPPDPNDPVLGDFDGDGKLSKETDYKIISEARQEYFLTSSSFDPKYDLNNDEKFNVLDLRKWSNLRNSLEGGE